MIDINALKGIMVSKGMTQKDLSKELGITPRTLTRKFQVGIFNSNEMERMIEILDIKDPKNIFFAKEVTR